MALERDEVELLAGLAHAQASRSSRARDLALVLAAAKSTVVLQRGDERAVARLLRDRGDLPRGLAALRGLVTTS